MLLLLTATALLAAGGLLAVVLTRWPKLSNATGAVTAIGACAIGLIPAIRTLITGGREQLSRPWDLPYASFTVELDGLSAFFVVPLLLVSGLIAMYASQYLLGFAGRKSLGAVWFFYNTMVAAMVLVVLARNGVLFLVAWEVMSVASYFLVTFESESDEVCENARVYLVATHLGTAFLLVFFILLGSPTGSLDFAKIASARQLSPSSASVLFLLALVGFGTKAGLMPFHVWSPRVYPVAPHHVAAVMSAVMSKMGIYGIMRTLVLVGHAEQWWAWTLIGIGALSGVLGILFALAQRDLKRLLAYSSVENVGIIALGLGTGMLGVSGGQLGLATLGFAGALFHVVNHSLFKSLLFLCAGIVRHVTGTRDIERLGGLLKRLPWTGAGFVLGAIAISGLPPLNGFVSEFLIYLSAFEEEMFLGTPIAVPALGVIGGLAIIGGLAAVCFTKAFGLVFLGQPRSAAAEAAPPSGILMRIPMVALALGCVLSAALAPRIVLSLGPAIGELTHADGAAIEQQLTLAVAPLPGIQLGSASLLGVILGLAIVRYSLLAGRDVRAAGTWGCGYLQPTARMQYTGSSYVQPLTVLTRVALRTRRSLERPQGYFPTSGALATETPDAWLELLYRPLFASVGWILARLRWLQHGHTYLYVLYIAATAVSLLVWYVGFRT